MKQIVEHVLAYLAPNITITNYNFEYEEFAYFFHFTILHG
jgi:hypothetical protein